jgi:hypothetical protein
MKLRVTLEIEVGDLPDEQRRELQDGVNFLEPGVLADEDDDLEALPSLADYEIDEIQDVVSEAFQGLSFYDIQSDLWSGSGCYICMTDVKVVTVDQMFDRPATAAPPVASGGWSDYVIEKPR